MPRTAAPSAPDALCRDSTSLARDAAVSMAGAEEAVGDHLGVRGEAPRSATHRFLARQPGYRGWEWSVVLMRAPRARHVTVAEVTLLPGEEALTAPEWVPWRERVRPGDLTPGDRLPTTEDDERLVPGYLLGGDPEVDETVEVGYALELGLGRRRVMSHDGRRAAAQRWFDGEFGPATRMAKAAPDRCATCGFYLHLAGWMGQGFGACGNEYASADGRVVSAEYGCGAHSEALVEPPSEPAGVAYDDWRLEFVRRRTMHPPGSVADAAPAEPLGHG